MTKEQKMLETAASVMMGIIFIVFVVIAMTNRSILVRPYRNEISRLNHELRQKDLQMEKIRSEYEEQEMGNAERFADSNGIYSVPVPYVGIGSADVLRRRDGP